MMMMMMMGWQALMMMMMMRLWPFSISPLQSVKIEIFKK